MDDDEEEYFDEEEYGPVIGPARWSWKVFTGDLLGCVAAVIHNAAIFVESSRDQMHSSYLLGREQEQAQDAQAEAKRMLDALNSLD